MNPSPVPARGSGRPGSSRPARPVPEDALAWWRIPGRLGPMLLALRGEAVAALRFEDAPGRGLVPPARDLDAAAAPLAREAARQIDEYLHGRRRVFELALDARGGAFAQGVWRELARLDYGERIGYARLAERLGLGAPHARAVARAVGANPLLLLLPCHRVLGSDGALRGYAGGLHRKRALLELELQR